MEYFEYFYRRVDTRSRAAMAAFLAGHFRYDPMNSWNRVSAHQVQTSLRKLISKRLVAREEERTVYVMDDEQFGTWVQSMR